MSEFRSPAVLPPIPNNLSVPQFFLDSFGPERPKHPAQSPWLIEDKSGRSLDRAEILSRSNALANALKIKWNLKEDDVVCLSSPNHMDYPICIWAAHRLGALISPANPAYTDKELSYQLDVIKAKGLIVYSDSLSTALAAASATGLTKDRIALIQGSGPVRGFLTVQDLVDFGASRPKSFTERILAPGEGKTKLAFLCFSSGTTGRPKAVVIPHYAVIANVIQMATHWKISDPNFRNKRMLPGSVTAGVLPFFHIYGLVVTLHFMIYAGISVVVVPRFSLQDFLKSIVRHKVTHLFLVPPQVVLLCKHLKEQKFESILYLMCGAAPLSGELLLHLTKFFPNGQVGQGYGLTETCTTVSTLAPDQKVAAAGSAGVLLPGITARVLKADGTFGREGEEGELVVKGPSNALAYLNNTQASKDTFIDGWVRTGDEVVFRNGEIYIVDRLKEIIKVRGFQVAPAELESHLLQADIITDACVVSVVDEFSGELPYAYVVLEKSIQASLQNSEEATARVKAQISKHISDAKINYKWIDPKRIAFIDSIPKTASGKLLRRQLRDKARAAVGQHAKL